MPGSVITVVPYEPGYAADCAGILGSLPEWFGFESANQEYLASLERLPAFVARLDGAVAGFIALAEQTASAAEIHVLAVDRMHHRHGIGRRLIEHAERWLRSRGNLLVYVMTLGPSNPDEGYRRTRAFYQALGFLPLFESTAFWGAEQPTLVLVKVL
jgi:GNAT superfamily N-acetyltransferase